MVNWTVPVFGMTLPAAAASITNTVLRYAGIFQWEEKDALNGEVTTGRIIQNT